jgi:phospholipid-translocating ATPase
MCILCGIGDHFYERHFFDRDSYWTFRATLRSDNPNINGLIAFLNGLITFQNIVPISLYISIEFVRSLQAFFIYADDEIWYKGKDYNEEEEAAQIEENSNEKGEKKKKKKLFSEEIGRRTTAKSFNLSDDLGQIEYIFSDKTGTLVSVDYTGWV